jgi:UDPglucose 6-dehydrogenase
MKIGFIGLGKLGLPCAEVIAEKGHEVSGFDINDVSSEIATIKSTIRDTVTSQNIVFVAVPTPHDFAYDGRYPTSHLSPKDFSYDIVKQVLVEANTSMNKDQLLVLISTVLPGTVRREFINLISNTRLIYNPYLIAMGSVAWDMVNPEMVMIGTEDGSETGDAKLLIEFYKTIMENDPRYVVGTWDECECIKVFYNTFISAKIGLVNMIQDVAEKQGNINVDVVTDALAQSTMRIMGPQYMKAGMGDGGACVLGDFLLNVDNENISIADLYNQYIDAPDQTRLIKSANYACSKIDYKKIDQVTSRQYSGKMYKFVTENGILETTADHLIPVWRNNRRIVVKAEEVIKTDKLYILDD